MNIGDKKYLQQGILCVLQLKNIPVTQDRLTAWQAEAWGDWDSLVAIGKALGIKIQEYKYHGEMEKLAEAKEPLLLLGKDGHWQVLGQANHQQVMVLDPVTGQAGPVTWQALRESSQGLCLRLTERLSLHSVSRNFGLGWFLPVLNRYRGCLGEMVLGAFLLQLLGIVTPVFTQVIIDKVIGQQGIATLTVLGNGLIFAAVFVCLMSIARKRLETDIAAKVDVILGSQLMHHLLALPLRYFQVRRVGDTLTRVSALNSIREFLTGSTITALLDGVFSIIFFGLMAYYSWQLTMLALLALPLYLVQNILVTPVYRKRLEEYWQAGARSNAFLVETVTGVQTVKALALEHRFINQWEELLAASLSRSFGSFKLGMLVNTGTSAVQNFSTLLILLVGGHMVMDGRLTIGQLIAFQMLARQGSEPLLRLSSMWQKAQQAMLSVKRLGDIMNTRPETASGTVLPKLSGAIEFRHVSFAYDAGQPPAVDDVSFCIEPGQQVGIVGGSGSGKSTISKLIEQLYLPAQGEVLVDGIDLNRLDRHWYRSRLGVVQQENILFRGTIRDNIAFGRPNASIEAVARAAVIAGAHEFIVDLPEGYDTQVGEQGDRLSGGQKQRIAIARALLMEPGILIFDEATSALDYHTESLVMKNMKAMAGGRTMVIIAHRLSWVKHCDKILVMHKGRLVEQGTHQELVEQKGEYYRLWMQQGV